MRVQQLLATLACASSVSAWGTLGHKTIAYLAEKHFTAKTSAYVKDILGSDDLGTAAIWADTYRLTAKYTAGWHYIDAMDSPPHQCNVNYQRDCHDDAGCVVSAIVNMTERIQDPKLNAADHNQALKFLIHFIGDIHQPLHTENEDKGGNGIDVLFDKKKTNLHSVWDTSIPEKITKNGTKASNEDVTAMAWATRLFSSSKKLAAKCTDITKAQECALVWAGEANAQVCSYVLKDDIAGVEGKDLGGTYYKGAAPVVETLISKAGARLGAWLNALSATASSTGGASGNVSNVAGDGAGEDGGFSRRRLSRWKRDVFPALGCAREY